MNHDPEEGDDREVSEERGLKEVTWYLGVFS